MNYAALASELTDDPLGRDYAGMTDQQAADSLNAVDRTSIRASMSGDEIFAATNGAEFGGLTDAKRAQWLAFCGRDSINPQGAANVAFVQYVFGGGSTTVASLVALRQTAISRGAELGFPTLGAGDIAIARAL